MSTTQSNSYSDTELEKLFVAASQGDLHTLQELLRDDANIDATWTWGLQWTVLTVASYHRQIPTVKYLLSKGASIDFKPQDGETALTIATHQGHADMFLFLRNKGADVNCKSFGGASILHETVAGVTPKKIEGKIQIMFGLLNKSFPIDTQDDADRTALHHAAFFGTRPLTTLLVNGGSNINAKDRWGNAPLDLAALEGHRKVVKFLLSRGATVNNNEGACNGLKFATLNGHRSIVTLLLDYWLRAVPRPPGGLQLLRAARSGDSSIVHELALRGFMYQAKMALCEAVVLDTADVVEVLLDLHVAFVNARNARGSTLLHLAVLAEIFSPRNEVIVLLLRRGADFMAKNFEGQTAEELALALGHTRALKILETVRALQPPCED